MVWDRCFYRSMKITAIRTGSIDTWMSLHARPLKYCGRSRIEVPVLCFLVECGKGKILFDAGQKPLSFVQDRKTADYYVKVSPEEIAVRKLAALDIAPDDLSFIILSHKHGDHVDGLEDFPNTEVIIRKQADPMPEKFRNRFRYIDGEFDVFGDGSVLCIPTPGHAPEHQSLLITHEDGSRELLIGDVVYLPEALDYEPDPDEYSRNSAYFDSIRKVRAMRDSGIKIRFSHFPYHPVSC